MRTRRSASHIRRLRRSRLEPLESRDLLAVLSVGPSNSFTTIQSAVDSARSGDVILIAEGVYQESVDLSRMGISVGGSGGSLVVRGDNGGQAVIESPGESVFSNSAAFAGDLSFEQLTFRPAAAALVDQGLTLQNYTGNLYVTDVDFLDLASGGIELNAADGGFSVVDSVFRDLGSDDDDAAIRVTDFAGVASIRGNVIEDVAGTAIEWKNDGGQVASLMIDDNTIRGEGTFFSTTRLGIVASLGEGTQTDLTLDDNDLESLAVAAIDVGVSGDATLHTRWSRNVASNIDGPVAMQFDLQGNAHAAAALLENSLTDVSGDGLVVSLHDDVTLDGTVQGNLFLSVGNAAGDDAMTIASSAGSSTVVNVNLLKNDFVTVAGMGLHLSADGTSTFRATVEDNFFTEVNTVDGSSAFLAEQATADAAADLHLRLADNDVLDSAGTAYSLRYRGSGSFDLEGTEADAASQIAAANTGQPIVVSGSVDVVPPGGLDAHLPQRIGGRIWLDENNNGVQNVGEGGIGGATLTLTGAETDGGANVAHTTQSDLDGNYAFVGLMPGQYTVTLELPSGHPLAEPNQGLDDSLDSDFILDEGNDDTALVTASLAAGGGLTLDAGLLRSWQNPRRPKGLYELDVNGDGFVTAVDALILINDINARGPRRLSDNPDTAPTTPPYLDVDGNGDAAPVDVLLVISFLNGDSGGAGEGEPGLEAAFSAQPEPRVSSGRQWMSVPTASRACVIDDAFVAELLWD